MPSGVCACAASAGGDLLVSSNFNKQQASCSAAKCKRHASLRLPRKAAQSAGVQPLASRRLGSAPCSSRNLAPATQHSSETTGMSGRPSEAASPVSHGAHGAHGGKPVASPGKVVGALVLASAASGDRPSLPVSSIEAPLRSSRLSTPGEQPSLAAFTIGGSQPEESRMGATAAVPSAARARATFSSELHIRALRREP